MSGSWIRFVSTERILTALMSPRSCLISFSFFSKLSSNLCDDYWLVRHASQVFTLKSRHRVEAGASHSHSVVSIFLNLANAKQAEHPRSCWRSKAQIHDRHSIKERFRKVKSFNTRIHRHTHKTRTECYRSLFKIKEEDAPKGGWCLLDDLLTCRVYIHTFSVPTWWKLPVKP